MHSNVIFDVTQSGYQSAYFPAFGLIFVVLGVILFGLYRAGKSLRDLFFKDASKRSWWVSPSLFLGFALLWTLSTFSFTYFDYRQLRSAFEEGRCQIVEGRIQNFSPGKDNRGETDETFDVSGVHFSYSAYSASPGFNQTVAKGGPLKEGVQVRIFVYKQNIARLEIIQDIHPNVAQ